MRRCTSPPFFVPPTRYKDKTLHDGEMKTQVGESRLYLKDSENKCSVLFPWRASFGMIHDAPMWRIAASPRLREPAVAGRADGSHPR